MTIEDAIAALDRDLSNQEHVQVFAWLELYMGLQKGDRLKTALSGLKRGGTKVPYEEPWWLDGKNLVSVIPSLSADNPYRIVGTIV